MIQDPNPLLALVLLSLAVWGWRKLRAWRLARTNAYIARLKVSMAKEFLFWMAAADALSVNPANRGDDEIEARETVAAADPQWLAELDLALAGADEGEDDS